jgi:cytochrome c551
MERHSTMRATTPLLFLLLILTGLFATACMGPDDPQEQLALACERQLEEIEEEHGGSDTPSAPSSDQRDEEQTLVQCAGQAPEAPVVADEGEGEGEGEGETEGEGDAAGTMPVGEELDPEARELFAASCGGCHALADADTSGAVGPDLNGLESTPEDVTEQIINGGGAMPAGLLEGEDAAKVGEYVAAAAQVAAS